MDGNSIATEFYGMEDVFPPEATQATVELKLFLWQRDYGNRYDCLDGHQHLMNFCKLNWDNEHVAFSRPDKKGKVYDNFFLEAVLKECCENKELWITGAASAGKTHPVGLYSLASFYGAPAKTTILTSTTSASGADGRIWSTMKQLHDDAKMKVGTPVEYIKSIVFDTSQELTGKKDTAQRDLRNALLVVPIGRGAEGKNATRAIIGRKNQHIIWIVDELPEMDNGILDETMANLESNEYFQCIGIGNASSRMDPHGVMCEPVDGWGTEPIGNEPYGGKWPTKSGGTCLFLDGHKSPNMHEELYEYTEKSDLPFPFLANHVSHTRNAERYGHGDPEAGKRTLPYLRMSRGIWPDSDIETTVLSRRLVEDSKANENDEFNYEDITTLCGCDPAFSAGGDDFVLQFSQMGTNWDGKQFLRLDREPIKLHPFAGEEFRVGMAKQIVKACQERGVDPSGFGIDASADGGLIAQEVMKEWKSTDIHLISSMGKPTNRIVSESDPRKCEEAYDRMVTELWFSVRVGVMTGQIKNFNVKAGYAADFFARYYLSKANDKIAIETKGETKKRITRSTDCGDALAYNIEVARRNGMHFTSITEVQGVRANIKDPYQVIAENKASAGAFDTASYTSGSDLFDAEAFSSEW